jgi:hypothetical protein
LMSMKLRTKIFAVSFSVSVALLGGAAVAIAAFSAGDDEARLESLSGYVGELSSLASGLADDDPERAAAMIRALEPIRRDLGRRAVLERDADLNAAVSWALLLLAEAAAALSVSAVAARMLTHRWSRLRDGILELRGGSRGALFFTGVRDEFGAVEEELDSLVAALGEKARMAAELRALQGWGEASAFLAHQARSPLASLTLSARTAKAALEAAGGSEPAGPLQEARAALSRTETEAARIAALFTRVRSISGFKDPELSRVDPEEALRAAALRLAAGGRPLGRDALTVERRGNRGAAAIRLGLPRRGVHQPDIQQPRSLRRARDRVRA